MEAQFELIEPRLDHTKPYTFASDKVRLIGLEKRQGTGPEKGHTDYFRAVTPRLGEDDRLDIGQRFHCDGHTYSISYVSVINNKYIIDCSRPKNGPQKKT